MALPTLTGSAAYAFSEVFHWQNGLDEKFKHAQAFYGVIVLSTLFGIALDFININPVRALYWTAIVNGLLAPFLLVGILLVARDKKIMLGQPSSSFSQIVVLGKTLLMFAPGIAMFVV